jgi:glycosyltransferase 2 family protein
LDRHVLKKHIKLFLKVTLSVVALWFVLRQIDLHQAKQLLVQIDMAWFVLAFMLFNLSKIVSAFRLNKYFQAIPVLLDWLQNLKLYYVGMFYNLFLPGSIGGDGYKIYLINKHYKANIKDLISASLLDRLSGLVALFFLAGILLYFSNHAALLPNLNLIIVLSLALVFPAYYLFSLILFNKKFIHQFWITSYYSLLVQFLQVVCAVCLLLALSVNQFYTDYLALFLISSAVSVLPITVGGVGIREVVFLLGYQYLPIDKTVAVSFSLLFFGITAVSSLIGIAFSVKEKPSVQLSEH